MEATEKETMIRHPSQSDDDYRVEATAIAIAYLLHYGLVEVAANLLACMDAESQQRITMRVCPPHPAQCHLSPAHSAEPS